MKRKITLIFAVFAILTLIVSVNSAFAIDPAKKPQRNNTTQQQKTKTTPKANPISKSQTKQVVTGSHCGYDVVDLGLSVDWATCNIGASSPSDYGNYYAWGEISTKTIYAYDNSKWNGMKYKDLMSQNIIDSNGEFHLQYDAAQQIWDGWWRMPTKEEMEELNNKCTWTWTTEGGHKGYRVKGPNGNSIFLPAAGYRSDKELIDAGKDGFYWSATADDFCGADGIYFDASSHDIKFNQFWKGGSIRPVK